jgi:hypothetical protein
MPRKQVAEPTARAISLVQEKSRADGIADDMAVADHRPRPRTKSDRSELPAKLARHGIRKREPIANEGGQLTPAAVAASLREGTLSLPWP